MIIFCDIDGVLNTSQSLSRSTPEKVYFDTQAVANLNTLLIATKASLVISSSWRLSLPENEILEIFKQNGARLVTYVGTTPILPLGMRGEEILLWLEEHHREGEPYLVLDDESGEINGKIPDLNFIHIDKGFDNEGFSQKYLQIALSRITYLL